MYIMYKDTVRSIEAYVRNLDACLEEVSVKSLEMIHTTLNK